MEKLRLWSEEREKGRGGRYHVGWWRVGVGQSVDVYFPFWLLNHTINRIKLMQNIYAYYVLSIHKKGFVSFSTVWEIHDLQIWSHGFLFIVFYFSFQIPF